ncbi:MAG: PLP-dependent transferase [Pirellulales bacterium]|nr:PLP-dependent transferase [Pirellulales bacterium]
MSCELAKLSPRRNSTAATSVEALVAEQLEHFGIDRRSEFGSAMARVAGRLYENQHDIERLWEITLATIEGLDRADRIAWFNATKFLTFQLAKSLDTLQNPFRRTYQSLAFSPTTQCAKGPYAVFDNVAAIFSANPVIARTATYIYSCAEWIEDAFQGKELMHDIYSRLLNPTAISLANHIVDLEAGPYAREYFAWNFNSGMAAVDAILAHLLGRRDVLIVGRNIYGGVHQLIFDWYAKSSNLDVAIEVFEGTTAGQFESFLDVVKRKHAARFAEDLHAYVHLESPCNPHGYVLDVPGICRAAHQHDMQVILDATVGTPFLVRPLQRPHEAERPDFVVHSYTKDLSGGGTVVAGVLIGKNEDMFLPKGTTTPTGKAWHDTVFWNVYYVKGSFLSADGAFEVLQGMRTLEMRMLAKCINTRILVRFLNHHPGITVHSNDLPGNPNAPMREELMYLGLPAPLFTIDLETAGVPRTAFQMFFDSLAPTFDHMISLGQSNTIVSCPALTTHSELSAEDLAKAGIPQTMIRIAVGDEDPRDLLAHLVHAARIAIDPALAGFSKQFPTAEQANQIIRDCHLQTQQKYIEARQVEY